MPDDKPPACHQYNEPAAQAPHPSPRATPTGGAWTYSVYGAAGELLGTFKGCSVGGVQFLCEARLRVYFGGRLILNGWTGVRPDRLGSPDGTHGRVYPYGEVSGSVSTDQDETYTTYTRDAYTGLDYAKNRSYAYSWGRFLTADPYRASGGPGDPGSWNRYAYAESNPVDFNDPLGLQMMPITVGVPVCFYVMGQLDSCESSTTTYWVEGWGGGGGGGSPSSGAEPGGGGGGDAHPKSGDPIAVVLYPTQRSCSDIADDINDVRDELARRFQEYGENKRPLPLFGRFSRAAHVQQIGNPQSTLRNLLTEFDTNGCVGTPGVPDDAWHFATRPKPAITPSRPSLTYGAIGAAAIIVTGTAILAPELLPFEFALVP